MGLKNHVFKKYVMLMNNPRTQLKNCSTHSYYSDLTSSMGMDEVEGTHSDKRQQMESFQLGRTLNGCEESLPPQISSA